MKQFPLSLACTRVNWLLMTLTVHAALSGSHRRHQLTAE